MQKIFIEARIKEARAQRTEIADVEFENKKLRSELDAEESRYEALDEKYKELDEKYDETVEWWKEEENKVAGRDAVIAELRSELSDLKQNSVTASEPSGKTLPDAATILSRLRGKRKKTPVTLADIETILGIIEES